MKFESGLRSDAFWKAMRKVKSTCWCANIPQEKLLFSIYFYVAWNSHQSSCPVL